MIFLNKFLYCLLLTLCFFPFSTFASEIYHGFDVSTYQGTINFQELPKDTYLYIKAGEGNDEVDDKFSENYKGAEEQGIHYGFYYYVTGKSVEEGENQAISFAKLIENTSYTLRPAMDFEDFSGLTLEESTEIALAFLQKLEELTGITPVIYSDASNVESRWTSAFASYPLWVADYENLSEPDTYELPKNNIWSSWSGYQYTDSATTTGITGKVDGDLFRSGIMVSGSTELDKDTSDSSEKDSSVSSDKESSETTSTTESTVIYNTIKKGDTLWGLSQYYGVSLDSLVEINDINNKNLIYVGETLKIPMKTTYFVKGGDTLSKIAEEFSTTIERLAEINHILEVDFIVVGEKLYIS